MRQPATGGRSLSGALPERRVPVDRNAIPAFDTAVGPGDTDRRRLRGIAEPDEHARVARRCVAPIGGCAADQRRFVWAEDLDAGADGDATPYVVAGFSRPIVRLKADTTYGTDQTQTHPMRPV